MSHVPCPMPLAPCPMTWTFVDVVDRIVAGLSALPGPEAQRRMAPVPRHGWKPGLLPDEARPAAALLVLYPVAGVAALLLTKRSSALPQHSGQVSLPGGAVNAGETLEQAALREAHEEIGLDPSLVTLLGGLTSLHIPVSGFVLNPFVGTVTSPPAVVVEPREVERVIEVPVAALVDPARHCRVTRMHDGIEIDVPYFDVDGERVWGATAMVLAEFAALLGTVVDPR
jgi:8-oxo-dGTP pyrophosphatase MutT (NUDIX family)